jgi:fluoride exporter
MLAWGSVLAVGGGAAVGAWLRWGLGIVLNPLFPTLPLGTLAANLGGGLLMGCAMELVTRHSMMTPELRLLATTGFLGGLTTFSTFSAEITTLLLRREWLWGAVGVASHVVGSILLTVIGILLMRAVFSWGGSA